MNSKTKVFTAAGGKGSHAVAEAAAMLSKGGLVAFPTETVYGIGADASRPDVVERLYEVKQRPAEKRFTLHIADPSDIDKHVREIIPPARKLVKKFWPGPLTIVFGEGENSVGVRCPANDVAREFLRRCTVPVVAPSANLSGQKPATTAGEVLAVFDGKIDGVLDGGPAPLRQSSTVLQISKRGWKVLREGIVSEEEIRKALRMNVIFVCTGNTCRSPLAEAMFRSSLAKRVGVKPEALAALGYTVGSAGTSAGFSGGASEGAYEAARQAGLDLSQHKARQLTPALIAESDRIFGMSKRHVEAAMMMAPSAAKKIMLLDPDGGDIEDPLGWPPEQFRALMARMQTMIDRRIDEIIQEAE